MTPMPVRESGAKRSRTRRFMSAPPYAGGGEMQGGGDLSCGASGPKENPNLKAPASNAALKMETAIQSLYDFELETYSPSIGVLYLNQEFAAFS